MAVSRPNPTEAQQSALSGADRPDPKSLAGSVLSAAALQSHSWDRWPYPNPVDGPVLRLERSDADHPDPRSPMAVSVVRLAFQQDQSALHFLHKRPFGCLHLSVSGERESSSIPFVRRFQDPILLSQTFSLMFRQSVVTTRAEAHRRRGVPHLVLQLGCPLSPSRRTDTACWGNPQAVSFFRRPPCPVFVLSLTNQPPCSAGRLPHQINRCRPVHTPS